MGENPASTFVNTNISKGRQWLALVKSRHFKNFSNTKKFPHHEINRYSCSHGST